MIELTSQQKANQKQNEKRKAQKGTLFTQVRFKNEKDLTQVMNTIKAYGGTKEQALIVAFNLLEKEIKRNSKT